MDPKANLDRQARLAARLQEIRKPENWNINTTPALLQEYREAADELVELVLDLDDWVKKGGFLPIPEKT